MDCKTMFCIIISAFLMVPCDARVIDEGDYISSLGTFLKEMSSPRYWTGELVNARDWLGDVSPYMELSPKLIKAHQALLLIVGRQEGNQCEPEQVQLIKLMKPVTDHIKKTYCYINNIFCRAHSTLLAEHARKCRVANLESLQKWKNNLGNNQKNVRALMDFELEHSCLADRLFIDTDNLFDLVIQQDPQAVIELKKCYTNDSRLKRSIVLYEKYIHKPCHEFREALGDIIFFVNREFERDEPTNIVRYLGYNLDMITRQLYEYSVKMRLCNNILTAKPLMIFVHYLKGVEANVGGKVNYYNDYFGKSDRTLMPEWLDDIKRGFHAHGNSKLDHFPCFRRLSHDLL